MKKSEYFEARQMWRDHWGGVFAQGVPGPGENPELLWDCVVTCGSEDCPNYGFFWRERVQENLDGVYRMMCGMCHSVITDMDPLLEDDPEYRFNCYFPDGTIWTEEPTDDRP